TEQEAALLSSDINEEALFGGAFDELFGGVVVEAGEASAAVLDEEELLASFDFSALANEPLEEQSDAWHFLLVKLEEGVDPAWAIQQFQRFFDEQGIEAVASGWLQGAGSIALLANGTKAIFNVVVLVIAVVAVIIIMNTLVISVTERTTEIGTMRALGAQKTFIRRMIVWETVITSGVFGLLGVVVGL